jgi:hypothetical protein
MLKGIGGQQIGSSFFTRKCECVYLDDLGGVGTDHVSANDSVGLPVDDELHEGLLVTLGQGVPEGRELGDVDIDLTVDLSGLRLGVAHARHRRRREHGWRQSTIQLIVGQ